MGSGTQAASPALHEDPAEMLGVDVKQLQAVDHYLGHLLPRNRLRAAVALSAPYLELSRDCADKSSGLTSLLLEIPPAKLIRLLPLVETGKYQPGRAVGPIRSSRDCTG